MWEHETIFSHDILQSLEIDFEPPLPANERFFELDEDEIIEVEHTVIQKYRCLRCKKTFQELSSFILCCQKHIPVFGKVLYNSSKILEVPNVDFESEIFEEQCKKRRPRQSTVTRYPQKSSIPGCYICDWCGMQFTLRGSIKAHLNVHLNNLKHCTLCDKKFTRQKTLLRHISVIHHGADRELKTHGNDHQNVNCMICDRAYESINNLRMHETSHLTTSATCVQCGIVCKSQKILLKHQKTHLNVKYSCEICGAQLSSMDSLRGHLKYMHSENKYRCGICFVEYRHRGNYNDHIAGHLDPKSKICEVCNFEWDSRRSCLEHKKKKHPHLKLEYALPKVDPTDPDMVEMLRKLIDALPRHNGKPNHLEVSMKSSGIVVESTVLESKIKKSGAGKVKKADGEVPVLKQKKRKKVVPDKEKIVVQKQKIVKELVSPEIALNGRPKRSTRLPERLKNTILELNKTKKVSPVVDALSSDTKNDRRKKSKLKKMVDNESFELVNNVEDEASSNKTYENSLDNSMTIQDHINQDGDVDSFIEYETFQDYSQTDVIFEDNFQVQSMTQPEPDDEELPLKKSSRSKTGRSKPKKHETMCQICNQSSTNIKIHLKLYHSDCLLDRICRICQKIAMCKRDLKEHVRIVHRKQFPAYQLELMQKRHPLCVELPTELYCFYCPAKFLEESHLKFHHEIMHANNEIPHRMSQQNIGVDCKLCGKSFPSQGIRFLKKHINSNHGHSLADCICFICGAVFVVKNFIKLHLERHHEGLTVKDYHQKCSAKIDKFKKENPEYSCDKCNHWYVDIGDLQYHRQIMHEVIETVSEPIVLPTSPVQRTFDFGEIIEYKCHDCQKTFFKKDVFEKHRQQHDFGLLYCQICAKNFTGIAQKREHDAYKHGLGRKPFMCDHCGAKITRRKALVAHFQLECPAFDERPHLKWNCAAMRQQKRELKVQKNGLELRKKRDRSKRIEENEQALKLSHGSEKKMCDLCGKICCNDYRLMEHGRKVHRVIFPQYEELYKRDCERVVCECGKVFNQKGHYLEHKKIHTVQLETCKTCGIIVKGKKTLARHELLHKPKSIRCDVCGMMFHQKRTMAVHKQEKHSLARYVCKYCTQEFKYGATYREHLKAHEVPNYLRCLICNKDYASRGCLRIHRKRTHPDVYGEPGQKSKNQRPQSWNQYLMQHVDNSTSIQIQFGAEETVTLMEDDVEQNMHTKFIKNNYS